MNQMMRNGMMAALGVGVLVAVAALLWTLHSGPGSQSAPADQAKVVAAKANAPSIDQGSTSAAPGAQSPASGASDDFSQQPAELPVEARKTTEMEVLLGRSVPRRLREWVAPCYNDGFTFKSLETDDHHIGIEYTLVRRGGVFALEDVKLTELIGKPDLEECILDSATELSWRVKGDASYTVPMSDELTLLDLKKFGAPLPHELEDEEALERDFDEEFGSKVKK